MLEGSVFKAGVERSKQRLKRRDSPQARADRLRSRSRYRNASRGQALSAAKRAFHEELGGPLFDGRRPAAGLEVSDLLGDDAAVVEDARGEKLLMRSTQALRARNSRGDLAPVDLSLREYAASFTTGNSNADLRIAKDARTGTAFTSAGFSVAPQASVQASEGIESDGRVFYDDVSGDSSDTAFLVAPQPAGAELSWLLLSAEAPERLVLEVDLPAGAVLRRARTDKPIPGDHPQNLEIAQGKKVLGYVQAPLVYDSEGVSVASDMRVRGRDGIVISVEHRGADLAYPLYADPEVSVPGSRYSGWAGWANSQYPSPAYQGVNYYGFALNNGAYNPNGVYMSMPTNTWFSPSGTSASFTYRAPASTYIYRTMFGGMSHSPLLPGYALSLWYQGLANSPVSWESNVSYYNQSGGYGGNPFGPAAHAAHGVTHDFCFNTRCDRSRGSTQNRAQLGLAASNPYNPNAAFYTYGYRAALTMDWANVFLGDRVAPKMTSAPPPSRDWTNDSDNPTHRLGTISAHDDGLGLNGITLSGAASGNTTRRPSCTGNPNSASTACPATWSTSGLSYTLDEGVNTLSLQANDIVDNSSTKQTWTEKIDRGKPDLQLNGWLPNTDGMVFAGVDYDLSVIASDGVSGVKSIEVLVDDQRLPEAGYQTQDCAPGVCDLILNTMLIPGSYAPGPHTVKVVAKDFAGNQRQAEIPVQISDVSAAPPRERDPIPDYKTDDENLPPLDEEPVLDTTCDPNATNGADTECDRNDLEDPIEQAVANEPPLVENVVTPLLNTLEALLTPSGARSARIAKPLNKNGSGWGVSDNKAQTFVPDDPATPNRIDNPATTEIDEGYLDLFTALDVTRLRLTVPWDLVPRGKGKFDNDPYPKTFGSRETSEDGKGPNDRILVGLGPYADDPTTPPEDPNEVRTAERRLKAIDQWIEKALPCDPDKRLGEVMISFEKSDELRPGREHENLLPTVDEYVYGVSQFRKRYLTRCQKDEDLDESSRITVYTAWNEPNFGLQPPRGEHLSRAGAYWSQLNRICKTTPIKAYRCTVAAGDLIDRQYRGGPRDEKPPGLQDDVRRFQDGMNRAASTWALHGYLSSHVSRDLARARIQRFLRVTESNSGRAPRLWLTEQGGRYDVPDDQGEATAEADFCNIMQFRKISNRITRLYYYPLVGPPPEEQDDGTFLKKNDSALIQLNSDLSITPREKQYETYKFYASKSGGSQQCPE